jgi:lysophospholipase
MTGTAATKAPFHADVADAPPGAAGHWLTASDGTRLRAVTWAAGERGTAVIFPGRTEFAEKYGRVAARLVARGFSVAVVDWRGQGLSDRPAANPMRGHVDDFREYQRDVAALLDLLDGLALPGPRLMVAHSMGGCIGLRTLLERADFSAAVFSAPMWHLQMRAATRELTARFTQLAYMMGFGMRLMPGTREKPTALAVDFDANALTTCRDTFAWCVSQIAAHPDLSLGGPSMQWTRAALEEMARLYIAPLPNLPVLALLGGEESVVSANVIRTQIGQMAQGRLLELPGARHEVLMERPEILDRLWGGIDDFLEAGPFRRGLAATG